MDIRGKDGLCDRKEESCVTSYTGRRMTSMRRDKLGHARRGTMEAEFRHKASMKDGEKLVQ